MIRFFPQKNERCRLKVVYVQIENKQNSHCMKRNWEKRWEEKKNQNYQYDEPQDDSTKMERKRMGRKSVTERKEKKEINCVNEEVESVENIFSVCWCDRRKWCWNYTRCDDNDDQTTRVFLPIHNFTRAHTHTRTEKVHLKISALASVFFCVFFFFSVLLRQMRIFRIHFFVVFLFFVLFYWFVCAKAQISMDFAQGTIYAYTLTHKQVSNANTIK